MNNKNEVYQGGDLPGTVAGVAASNKSQKGDQSEHKCTDKLLSGYWKVWRRQVYCATFRQWCGEMIHCHIYLRLCPPPMPPIVKEIK